MNSEPATATNQPPAMSKRPASDDAGGAPKRALTKAEAAVYDRQLRVWGVEAQQR